MSKLRETVILNTNSELKVSDNELCYNGISIGKGNTEKVIESIKKNPAIYFTLSDFWKNYTKIIDALLKKDVMQFDKLSQDIKNEIQVNKIAIKYVYPFFEKLPKYDIILEDMKCCKRIIRFYPSKLLSFPERIYNKIELSLYITKLDPMNVRFVPFKFRNNFMFMKNLIIQNPLCYKYASHNLKKNRELSLLAIKSNENIIKYVPEDYNDKDQLEMMLFHITKAIKATLQIANINKILTKFYTHTLSYIEEKKSIIQNLSGETNLLKLKIQLSIFGFLQKEFIDSVNIIHANKIYEFLEPNESTTFLNFYNILKSEILRMDCILLISLKRLTNEFVLNHKLINKLSNDTNENLAIRFDRLFLFVFENFENKTNDKELLKSWETIFRLHKLSLNF